MARTSRVKCFIRELSALIVMIRILLSSILTPINCARVVMCPMIKIRLALTPLPIISIKVERKVRSAWNVTCLRKLTWGLMPVEITVFVYLGQIYRLSMDHLMPAINVITTKMPNGQRMQLNKEREKNAQKKSGTRKHFMHSELENRKRKIF